MTKTLRVLNSISFLLVLFANYLSNTGFINNTTIGEISQDYNTLFTPAGYTFAIWGLIYLLLLGFIIYQAKNLSADFIKKIGWWFVLSCVFNICWIVAWLYNITGFSCILILLLLFSLLKIVNNTRIALDDKPITIIAFLWWPFTVYVGWVAVASIANIAAYLNKIEWKGLGMSEVFWAIVMISIAVIINLLVVWQRNMREFALVGAWALIGIGVANQLNHEIVTNVSYIGAGILLLVATAHAWKNRQTNPLKKLQEYMASRTNP